MAILGNKWQTNTYAFPGRSCGNHEQDKPDRDSSENLSWILYYT